MQMRSRLVTHDAVMTLRAATQAQEVGIAALMQDQIELRQMFHDATVDESDHSEPSEDGERVLVLNDLRHARGQPAVSPPIVIVPLMLFAFRRRCSAASSRLLKDSTTGLAASPRRSERWRSRATRSFAPFQPPAHVMKTPQSEQSGSLRSMGQGLELQDAPHIASGSRVLSGHSDVSDCSDQNRCLPDAHGAGSATMPAGLSEAMTTTSLVSCAQTGISAHPDAFLVVSSVEFDLQHLGSQSPFVGGLYRERGGDCDGTDLAERGRAGPHHCADEGFEDSTS